MATILHTIRNYAELSRLSNIPTVATNVLVGCAIGSTAAADQSQPLTIALVTIAMMLLYIAGMALNDCFDATIDAIERPSRPIPSGRISRRSALIFTIICMAIGLGIMAFHSWYALFMALGLALTIVAYDLLHKKFTASLLLMGLCRSLVYLAAAAAIAWPIDWSVAGPLALIILLYITVLTVIASGEASEAIGQRKWLALLPPLLAISAIFFIRPEEPKWAILFGMLLLAQMIFAMGHVMGRTPHLKHAIMAWLSGICLLDGFFLSLLDKPLAALIALGCFALTAWGHRYILGT